MIAILNKSPESPADTTLALNGPEGPRLFTADEYQRLADVRILGDDDRVELIEWRIVGLAAKNIKHAMTTKRTNRYFTRLFGDRVMVSVQDRYPAQSTKPRAGRLSTDERQWLPQQTNLLRRRGFQPGSF